MQVSDIRVRAQFTSEACAGSFLLLQGIRKETLVFPLVLTHFQSKAYFFDQESTFLGSKKS